MPSSPGRRSSARRSLSALPKRQSGDRLESGAARTCRGQASGNRDHGKASFENGARSGAFLRDRGDGSSGSPAGPLASLSQKGSERQPDRPRFRRSKSRRVAVATDSTERMSARLENNTYVLRSIGCGTNRVHQRLNRWRAIPLCCMAKIPRRTALINSDGTRGPGSPESMDLGTPMLPTNPMA